MKKITVSILISVIISFIINKILKFLIWQDAPFMCNVPPCYSPDGKLFNSFIGHIIRSDYLFWIFFIVMLTITLLIAYKPWKNTTN